jgi:hypothetical protein
MYVLGGFWIENDSHSRPVGGGDSANNKKYNVAIIRDDNSKRFLEY